MVSSVEFERGDARDDALSVEDGSAALDVDEAPLDPALFTLSSDQYWNWLTVLMQRGNAWITASNFLISIVMLVVTILFWMEFR